MFSNQLVFSNNSHEYNMLSKMYKNRVYYIDNNQIKRVYLILANVSAAMFDKCEPERKDICRYQKGISRRRVI